MEVVLVAARLLFSWLLLLRALLVLLPCCTQRLHLRVMLLISLFLFRFGGGVAICTRREQRRNRSATPDKYLLCYGPDMEPRPTAVHASSQLGGSENKGIRTQGTQRTGCTLL